MDTQLIFFIFLFILDGLYFYNVDEGFGFFLINSFVQMMWFNVVAIIPCVLTEKMMWVDIAWPWGVFFLGAQALFFSTSASPRRFIICAIYIIIGLRMGAGALMLIPKRKKDFPRYDYAKMKFEKKNPGKVQMSMLIDIYMQAIANIMPLYFPVRMLSYNESPISTIESSLYCMFVGFYIFESVADGQKLHFIKTCENKRTDVCRIGLWQYSRHPNYFGQWMQWNSIALASVICVLVEDMALTRKVAITAFHAGLLSYTFYICLVYWTGAKPAEYFSVKKRPAYKRYQREVNMFVPWFPKDSSTEL